jgi:acyl-CoA hydrolase
MASLSEKEYADLLAANPDLLIEQEGNNKPNEGRVPDISLNNGTTVRKDGELFFTITEPRNKEMSEHQDQVILFNFIRALESRYPSLEYVYAVPNGGYRPKRTAAMMKAEGQKAGVPDIWVPVVRGNKNGLVIEMKKGYNKPTDDQVLWLNRMVAQNWVAFVAYHRDTARKLILRYLGLPDITFEEIL